MSSTTSSAPSASASSNRVQVEIPSSTVLAIGLGFVGLIAILISSTLILRVIRVRRRMRASREAGQPIGFSDAWQREGGIFGFLSSLGNANMAVGAGSSMVRAGDRIWGPVYSEKARPIMWDVPIRENTKDVGNLDFNDTFEPFSLSSTIPPRYIDRATPAEDLPRPRFTFSLLISLPSEPHKYSINESSAENGEDETWADIPEVVIGTTEACPMLVQANILQKEGLEEKTSAISGEYTAGGKATEAPGEDSQQLDYASGEGRPARWERYDVIKWRIEGMR